MSEDDRIQSSREREDLRITDGERLQTLCGNYVHLWLTSEQAVDDMQIEIGVGQKPRTLYSLAQFAQDAVVTSLSVW